MSSEKVMTMICLSSDHKYEVAPLVIGHLWVIATILVISWFSVVFSRKLHFFLIKERAPLLALIQCLAFLSTILVPYIREVMVLAGYDWPASGIPIDRRIFKGTYMACRVLCYAIFLLR